MTQGQYCAKLPGTKAEGGGAEDHISDETDLAQTDLWPGMGLSAPSLTYSMPKQQKIRRLISQAQMRCDMKTPNGIVITSHSMHCMYYGDKFCAVCRVTAACYAK